MLFGESSVGTIVHRAVDVRISDRGAVPLEAAGLTTPEKTAISAATLAELHFVVNLAADDEIRVV